MEKINTFKIYFKLIKGNPHPMHDWFGFHFYICNEIQLSITILGYGFIIGILIFDVNKKLCEDVEDGKRNCNG